MIKILFLVCAFALSDVCFSRSPDTYWSVGPEVTFEEIRITAPVVFLAETRGSVFTGLQNYTSVIRLHGLTITDFGLVEWTPAGVLKGGTLNLELRRYVNRSETSEYISISIPPASWIRGNSTSARCECRC